MPSNSSGLSKRETRIYSPGSGGYTTNHASQDDPPMDELDMRRWRLFAHENSGRYANSQALRAAFLEYWKR